MAKWPLRFRGGPGDMAADDFVFRIETLARMNHINEATLVLGLHQVLTHSAAEWYWVVMRNEPNVTWARLRSVLTSAFQSAEPDEAIRRRISDRLQRSGETFMQFCIAIQVMEARLAVRMTEQELVDILKRNMLPEHQYKLVFEQPPSVCVLQQRVLLLEGLAQQLRARNPSQSGVQHLGRIASFVPTTKVELQTPSVAAISAVPLEPSNPFACTSEQEQFFVSALDKRRGQFEICWNCDEIGHSYMDCTAPRIVFCFGCGAKNTYRRNCARCSLSHPSGNDRRNGRVTETSLADPKLASHPLRNPHPFPRP